jgi:hypothetical protein
MEYLFIIRRLKPTPLTLHNAGLVCLPGVMITWYQATCLSSIQRHKGQQPQGVIPYADYDTVG